MTGVTIYTVAERARVSPKTVSRVFNAEPNVRAEVRDRVYAVAEELGYRPNLAARRLRGSTSQLLVGLVDAPLTLSHLRSAHGAHFLDQFQLGAMLRCREAGYHLMIELVEVGRAETRSQISKLLSSLRPDGVILTQPSCDDGAILDLLEAAETPYVRLGPEQEVERGARVSMDDRAAAACMTRHLLELGHFDIGFILGSRRYPAAQLRLAGYSEAMREAGLPVRPERICEGDFTFESGLASATELLQHRNRPTAIFASNDEMALGVLHAAVGLGLSTPDDISVVGFDDVGSARFAIPPLTTIRQPVSEMAMAAASMLVAPRREPDSQSELLPFELVIRGSSAGPPSLSPARAAAQKTAASAAKPNSRA